MSRNKHYKTQIPKYPCISRKATEEEQIEFTSLAIQGLQNIISKETCNVFYKDDLKDAKETLGRLTGEGI